VLGQLRLLFGWQAFDRLSLFGGPTLSVFVHKRHATNELERPGYQYVVFDNGDDEGTRVRLWPGFTAGLRF
jgi:hypothetical protein